MWRVTLAGYAAETLRAAHRRAQQAGGGRPVTEAFAALVVRLRADPLAAGEPAYYLSTAVVRRVALAPIIVYYAVHLTEPAVFVSSVHLLPTRS